jgi:hypothetical protein
MGPRVAGRKCQYAEPFARRERYGMVGSREVTGRQEAVSRITRFQSNRSKANRAITKEPGGELRDPPYVKTRGFGSREKYASKRAFP